jgi:hypothetical protein
MSCLFALVAVSIIGLFFPMGSAFQLLLAFFGAVLFSACARCTCSPPLRARALRRATHVCSVRAFAGS